MSLFSLYPSILVPILFEWSFDDEVCCVDSATCSKQHRMNVLYSLSLGKVTNSRRLKNDEERYQWMILREIELKCYYISDLNNERSGRRATLLSRTSNLVVLEAKTDGLASLISVHGIYSQSLKLYGSSEDIAVEDILRALECSVLHLDLHQCFGLTDAIYPKIALLCPNLISFRHPYYAMHSIPFLVASIINVPMYEVLDMIDCSSANIGNKFEALCTFESTTECNSSCVTISGKRYTLTKIEFQELELPSLCQPIANVHTLQIGSELAQFSPIDKFLSPANRLRCFHAYDVVFEPISLIACLKNCVHLVSVIFEQCSNVTEQVLLSLAEFCPKLETLTITTEVTEAAATQFFVKCTWLNTCLFGRSVNWNAALCHLISRVDALSLTVMSNSIECFTEREYKYLRASASKISGREELSMLLKSNCRLSRVEFNNCPHVSDSVIEELVGFCPTLTSVSISHCSTTARCLIPLSRCQRLLRLCLRNFVSLSDDLVEQFLKHQPKLEKLVLNGTIGFTGKVLFMIAKHCPALKHLNMAWSVAIDSQGIIELLKNSKDLNCLDVRACSHVTCDILPWLKLKGMRFLNIEKTGITKSEMNLFVEETGFSCSYDLLY